MGLTIESVHLATKSHIRAMEKLVCVANLVAAVQTHGSKLVAESVSGLQTHVAGVSNNLMHICRVRVSGVQT